jgi:hypothetical protein
MSPVPITAIVYVSAAKLSGTKSGDVISKSNAPIFLMKHLRDSRKVCQLSSQRLGFCERMATSKEVLDTVVALVE